MKSDILEVGGRKIPVTYCNTVIVGAGAAAMGCVNHLVRFFPCFVLGSLYRMHDVLQQMSAAESHGRYFPQHYATRGTDIKG